MKTHYAKECKHTQTLKMDEARETARQIAFEKIKTAGEKDWRALVEWAKLTFPEYRPRRKNRSDGKRNCREFPCAKRGATARA